MASGWAEVALSLWALHLPEEVSWSCIVSPHQMECRGPGGSAGVVQGPGTAVRLLSRRTGRGLPSSCSPRLFPQPHAGTQQVCPSVQ